MDANYFREAMSRWASGVTVVACRHEGRVIATTVSAFLSLSLEPAEVMLVLGGNATVLPFLVDHAVCGVSVLSAAQRRLAAVFADSFAVTADPFSADGAPVLPDALLRLSCTVRETRAVGDHTLIFARVDQAHFTDAAPLVRFRRRYHGLAPS